MTRVLIVLGLGLLVALSTVACGRKGTLQPQPSAEKTKASDEQTQRR